MNSAINSLEAKIKETVLRLPLVVGNAAVNWTIDSFRVQGFRTVSTIGTAWQQRRDTGRKSQGRAILIQSGRLRRSIRILSLGVGSVSIGSDLPYAAVHNEGLTIHRTGGTRVIHFKSVSQNIATHKLKGKFSKRSKADYAQKVEIGPHDVPMPRRQFMPTSASESPIFVKEMEAVITRELKPFFN